jgi:type IV/VI secretion system ImpK/VasF family protein
MNQELWLKIVTINSFLSPLRIASVQSTMSMIDLVGLRSQLRDQLEDLRAVLTELYSERDAYFVLFPLTAHCDEVVKMLILDTQHLDWPPLQQELYQVADAGDLFYELLDNALSKPETLPLVYEVYYFCLQDGFCGRYSVNPKRVTDYLQKLQKHIRIAPIMASSLRSATTKRSYFRIPNYSYYCASLFLLVLVYFLLTFTASTWQPI